VQSTSGISAPRTLRGGTTFDLLVTDHARPGLPGSELARLINQSLAQPADHPGDAANPSFDQRKQGFPCA